MTSRTLRALLGMALLRPGPACSGEVPPVVAPAEAATLSSSYAAGQFTQVHSALFDIRSRLRREGKLPDRSEYITTRILAEQRAAAPVAKAAQLKAVLLQDIGDLAFELNLLGQAKRAYGDALKTGPSPALKAMLLHGLASVAIHEDDEAFASYRAARALFRQAAALKHPDAHLGFLSRYGLCFTSWHVWWYGNKDQKAWEEAVSECRLALKTGRNEAESARIYETLGAMYADRGDRKLSALNYENCVRRDPASASARYGLGQQYLWLGQPGKAREHWKVLETLDPARAKRLLEGIRSAEGRSP